MPTPKKYIRLDKKGLGLVHVEGIFQGFLRDHGGQHKPFASGRLVLRAGSWQRFGP